MSVIGSNILAGASGQGGDYTIARSLRFRSSASAWLNRTPASAGNRKTWTYSAWIKRGTLTGTQVLFAGASYEFRIISDGGSSGVVDSLQFSYSGGYGIQTSPVLRDPSAWYHVMLVVDTTQATASNRAKIYLNGNQLTSSGATDFTLNLDTDVNNTVVHAIGRRHNNTILHFDGYLAEVNFIDGQALTPSSFGAFNASTGVWQPKRYAGTYGTNGFYLPFSDNASTTTLGSDFSGNGNNWTTNNISLTAGSTYDSMTDVPTLTSATAANFAVLNPLGITNASQTLTNGNLTHTSSTNWLLAYSTISMRSGKFYAELTATDVSNFGLGIISTSGSSIVNANTANSGYVGKYSDGYGWQNNFGTTDKVNNNSYTSYGTAPSNGDIIMVAFDADAGSLYFGRNGTWFNSSNPATSTSPAFSSIPMTVDYYFSSGMENANGSWNFGQRPFAYTPPTGFVALNTFNLPTPTIGATASTQANKYFDISLYTGTGANQSVTNSGSMQPDLVWVKSRSNGLYHHLVDSVRGVNKDLFSNATDAEFNYSSGGSITAFNSNGFSLGTQSTEVNGNGYTFVGWQWRASNATGVSNTAGSITSTVSANTSAGFSVVSWTSNGSNSISTMGHGLGVAPAMIVAKRRSSTGGDWRVYHKNMSVPTDRFLKLNSTDSEQNPSKTIWSTSSTTFGIWQSDICTNGDTAIAYVFSEVAGYSKFGSFVGNGSADGTFVALPFRPKFIMVKRTDSTGFWTMLDASRSPFNVADDALYANASNAESTPAQNTDFLSNGFKFRSTDSDTNSNGGTHIYMAFAEVPQKFSLAR